MSGSNTPSARIPPTIIATMDALTSWGIHARAAQLFRFDKKRYDALVKQGFNFEI